MNSFIEHVAEAQGEIAIHCKHDIMMPIGALKSKFHPKNPNSHSKEQIERLAKMYSYHGVRLPVIISNRSDWIAAGHGRVLAADHVGMKSFPVTFQDFKDSDAEYAFMVADNAIGEWSELDLSAINIDIGDLDGTCFDMDMLGLKDFCVEPMDKFDPGTLEDQGKLDEKQMTKCPNCGEIFDHAKNKA